MSASLSMNFSGLDEIAQKYSNPAISNEIKNINKNTQLLAIVSQAISEIFEKEGPGWAPLSGGTLRASATKKDKKFFASMTDKDIEKEEKKRRSSGGGKTRPILQKSKMLIHSVTTAGAQYNISPMTKPVEGVLNWGSSLPYAGIQNYGDPKKNIPQREFLGKNGKLAPDVMADLHDKVIELILEILAKHT